MPNQNLDKEALGDIIIVLDLTIKGLETIVLIQDHFQKIHKENKAPKNFNPAWFGIVLLNMTIITLFRYIELYEMHKAILNKITANTPKKLYNELKDAKIREIRNRFSGHPFDRDTKKTDIYRANV